MSDNLPITMTYRFAYNHIESDGKFVNLTEALEAMDADHVCLSVTNDHLDPAILDDDTIKHRFARLQTVMQMLRRERITPELVLPSLTHQNPDDSTMIRYCQKLYTPAASLKIRKLWIDDSLAPPHRSFHRKKLIAWSDKVDKPVHVRYCYTNIPQPPFLYNGVGLPAAMFTSLGE